MKLALGFACSINFQYWVMNPTYCMPKINSHVEKITKNVFDNSLTIIKINPTNVAIVILMVSCMLGNIPVLNCNFLG